MRRVPVVSLVLGDANLQKKNKKKKGHKKTKVTTLNDDGTISPDFDGVANGSMDYLDVTGE